MKTLEEIRKEIDAIDDTLMHQLNRRFSLMKAVKEIKKQTATAVFDASREQDIFNKANSFEHKNAIKDVYRLIIQHAKDLQREN